MKQATIIRGLAVILGAVMTVTVVGCSGIPRTGVVHQGEPVMQDETNTIEFLPASPLLDATQEQILRGFLDAASSPQDDFAIARQFLATPFKTEWDASASVVVDLGVRSITPTEENSATLSTATSATVDARGQYTEIKPSSALQLPYTFVNEQGQWRIASAPPGVLIDQFTFDQVFATHPLYFFDPTFLKLVPDVRWFPTGSSTATRIMKALLAGPAPWLAEGGAVVSAFPPGTELVADAVPIAGGVAMVDLTSQVLEASRTGMQKMQTQAMASLNSIGTVSGVHILVEGNVQNNAATTGSAIDAVTRVDARPVVLQNGKFGFVDGETLIAIPGLSELIEPIGASAIAVSPTLNLAAALTPSGVVLVRSPGGVSVLDTRLGLITPALDSSNYIWSVSQSTPTEIFIYSTDGQVSTVTAPWAEASRIVSLNVARDGTRLVALLEQGGSVRFVVANIQRGERNRPVAIGTPMALAADSGVAIDATWADSLSVVALVTSPDGTSRMTRQNIGGQSETLPATANIVSLAGANSISQLRIRSADNQLFVLRGSSYWQVITSGVGVLAVLQ
jgi:hypothetical protein